MELYNVHKNPGFCCNLQQKLTSVLAYAMARKFSFQIGSSTISKARNDNMNN